MCNFKLLELLGTAHIRVVEAVIGTKDNPELRCHITT